MARTFRPFRAGTALVLVLAACRTVPARSEVPAVITNSGPQSRVALAEAVSQALNGATATLADDALTKSDVLIIERANPRDPGGQPLNGRERGRAEHFRLVKDGDQCILILQRNDRRFSLRSVTCSAL